MRHGRLVLLAWLSMFATASAQTTTSPPETVFVPFFGSAGLQTARVSGEALVARLMSFDRNSDGRVATDELLERMQHLMPRGDADGDGGLNAREIRALATASTAPGTVRGFGAGQYAVGSEIGLSSRAHIEGALDDLKLAESARLQAIAVSEEFLTAFNAGAAVDLLKYMESLLTPEQLADFKIALERQSARVADLAVHIGRYQLPPRENHQAHAALGRFSGERRMDDAARSALVENMKGILTEEERNDFRAALARRPVVKVATHTDAIALVNEAMRLRVVARPVD